MQEYAYVYGVIIKNSKKTPLVDQIISGKDADNNILGSGNSVWGITN